jgi:signal transduction histidine kinase
MRMPLRLRLTLVFGIGMAAVLVGIGAYVYSRVGADLLASVDAGLRSRAQVVANAIVEEATPSLGEGGLIDPDEAIAQVLDENGAIVAASSAVSEAPLLTQEQVHAIAEPVFGTRMIVAADEDDPFRVLAVAVDAPARRIVVVGATLSDTTEALQQLMNAFLTVGPFVFVVVIWAGWLLAGAALAPVERMRQQAASVSASEPERRLTVPQTGDEVARLATTLNVMLDRLQEAIERERHFVDSASHELRTPLATLRGEIDLALIRPRKAEELESSLRSAQDDVHHLQRLTEDLLVLARARGGRLPVRRVKTHIAPLIAKIVQLLEGQAREAEVKILVDAPPDFEAEIDPDRIAQALRNLIENAVRHSPRGAAVRVSAQQTDGGVRISVTDTGRGFAPELLPTVFDAFSKGRLGPLIPDGTGLGLAIVRAVAEAHGGKASATNTPSGACVSVDIRS